MDTQGMIFVFGSNLMGIHGGGAAYEAATRGYPLGLGSGLHLGSGCYAIPTKTSPRLKLMSAEQVGLYVAQFMEQAERSRFDYQVTRIGCGLAGFSDAEIAPMFEAAPPNCYFDEKWEMYLPQGTRFWGTF